MKLETLRRFLLAALAVLAFQGSSAREAIAKRAEYDAALERAYEWSKQTHAAEERAMGDLALEARDLLRHPPEVADPSARETPDAAAVARSGPEATGPTRSSDRRPWLAWLRPDWGRSAARAPSEPATEVAKASPPADVEPSQPTPSPIEMPPTAEDAPAPGRVATWWKQIRALRIAAPAPGGESAETPAPATEAQEPGLWAWFSEQSIPDRESDATEETATERATPSPVARLWAWLSETLPIGADREETPIPAPGDATPWLGARLWAWVSEALPTGADREETPIPAPGDATPWLGARLWAWLNEKGQGGADTEEISAPTDEAVWPGSRIWAWLSEPSLELDESIERAAEEKTAWPGARLWARLAALFGGSAAPYTGGATQVAVVEAPHETEPVAPSSAKTTSEPLAAPSVSAAADRSIGSELAEQTPAHDPSAYGATGKIAAKNVRTTRPARRTLIAHASTDPPEPPPGSTTAARRAAAAQPAAASAPRQAGPAMPDLRPIASEPGTAGPSPPRAEPARAAKRNAVGRTAPARHVKAKATPPPVQMPRGRAPSETERRPELAARHERAPEPPEPAPRRSRPAAAPTVAARPVPPAAPPARDAELPPRLSSRSEARDELATRAERRPRKEPHAPEPRSALWRPPRPQLQPPLPAPAEPWQKRGRALARQELARVQAALQRDGRSTQEIDPLRVAIDILRAGQRQERTAAERR